MQAAFAPEAGRAFFLHDLIENEQGAPGRASPWF